MKQQNPTVPVVVDERVPPGEVWIGPIRRAHEGERAGALMPQVRIINVGPPSTPDYVPCIKCGWSTRDRTPDGDAICRGCQMKGWGLDDE